MIIEELLSDRKMSRYRLSKESGIPQATISDICSGKTSLEKCSAGTLYRMAKVLNVTVDSLLEASFSEKEKQHRSSFETFKSNTCHYVKDLGEIDFIIHTLEQDMIGELYQKKWYPEAMYLLAMVDYLSRRNDLQLCTRYDAIRQQKLAQPLYPSGVLIRAAVTQNEEVKREAMKKAIPEFLRFNIVEYEVDDIA